MDASTLAELIYPLRTILNFYINFMIAVYYWSLLTPKLKFRSRKAFVLTVGICFLCMPIGLLLYSHYALKIMLSILASIFLLGLVYEDSVFRRSVVVLFYMVLLMLSEALIAAIAVIHLGVSMPMMASDPETVWKMMPYQVAVYTLCYGLPALLAKKWPKRRENLPFGQFLILPLSQIIMMGGFLYSLYIGERTMSTSDAVITAVMILSCVVTDMVFVRIVRSLVEKRQLEEQQALQKRHYAALVEQQHSIRALRHDIRNHLMTASVLAREDSGQAEAYLQRLTEEFSRMTAIDYCENKIVDAVLYGKSVEAAAMGIRYSVRGALSEGKRIDDLDLISLLSNLLDNALTAAAQTEEKTVEVAMGEKGGAVVIRVRNSIDPDQMPDLSQTTKKNKQAHGMGIRIVEGICRKYQGSFLTSVQDGKFEAAAMLMDLEISGRSNRRV